MITARRISFMARDGRSPDPAGGPQVALRCPTCLEPIPVGADPCPECGEPVAPPKSTVGMPSIPDAPPNASWLALHWRPVVTLGSIALLLFTGVLLRSLAPDRFSPSRAASAQAPVPTCPTPCWSGEACQLGRCVWQRPNDLSHVAAATSVPSGPSASPSAGASASPSAGPSGPSVGPSGPSVGPSGPSVGPSLGGPFALPKDASDAILLDDERFAIALLTGAQIRSARTGEVLSLISEAPQSRRLHRVGDVVYATAPARIYVLHAAAPRVLKTIELGALAEDLVVGASGRRVLASLPAAHAVSILSTEFHAEVERIQFGDDAVGPVAVDDSGARALTTTGQIPLPGLREPAGGAAYAFDPSRLGWEQDRVRASLVGNPVSVLMAPDGELSLVALRAAGALAPLRWLPSGAVRQEDRIPTCKEPEQLALVRSERRALVRCNDGRAVQVLDLEKLALLQTLDFNGRAVDLAVSPDSAQAAVAITGDGRGSVALVDLRTYAVSTVPLTAEPTRVRYAPDGRAAIVLSERAKLAWVIR